MAAWITVYCKRTLAHVTPAALAEGLGRADFHTTTELAVAGVCLVDCHRGQNDGPLDDLLPEGRHFEQHQAVVEHADEQAAEHRAPDGAAPAAQGRAADDDRGDGV